MGLNGRREKLILQAVTVMWSAGTGGEVRRPGHLFWCALQRSCPASAWAASELPCHHGPRWKRPETCCWRLWEPATYTCGKKSQEKTAPFIAKFPDTFSDLVWPLTLLLGRSEKKHTSDALRQGTVASLLSSSSPKSQMPWELIYGTPLDPTPLLQRKAGQSSCRSGVHAEEQQQGKSRQLYPELPSMSQAGAGSPNSGDSGPHRTRSKQPWHCQWGRQAASTEHQQTLRHMSCSVCCRIPVPLQLFFSTFKLPLCRCTCFIHCHSPRVPLALCRRLDARFRVPRTERGTSSWSGKSSLCQQPGKQEGVPVFGWHAQLSSRLFVGDYSGAKLGLLGHSCERTSLSKKGEHIIQNSRADRLQNEKNKYSKTEQPLKKQQSRK